MPDHNRLRIVANLKRESSLNSRYSKLALLEAYIPFVKGLTGGKWTEQSLIHHQLMSNQAIELCKIDKPDDVAKLREKLARRHKRRS